MKTFKVNYLVKDQMKTAYYSEYTESDAGLRFSKTHPDISADDVISVTDMNKGNQVAVTDIEIPFWSLVWFFVTAAIAAIPAMIILFILAAGFTAIFGGIGHLMR